MVADIEKNGSVAAGENLVREEQSREGTMRLADEASDGGGRCSRLSRIVEWRTKRLLKSSEIRGRCAERPSYWRRTRRSKNADVKQADESSEGKQRAVRHAQNTLSVFRLGKKERVEDWREEIKAITQVDEVGERKLVPDTE